MEKAALRLWGHYHCNCRYRVVRDSRRCSVFELKRNGILNIIPNTGDSAVRRHCSISCKPNGEEHEVEEVVVNKAEESEWWWWLFQADNSSNSALISASLVGLLTGFSVVLFNNLVHELRELCWDGIPYQGASWLREMPVSSTWPRTILVPVSGGLLVSLLNSLRHALDSPSQQQLRVRPLVQQLLNSLAACITLGTGNSLGPEGPSVEIGSSIAKGVATLFPKGLAKLPLVAAGSAAGIASGFNAAVAGCFFAVESVLWPSPDSAVSLTNTTSMVILSAVIASVLSQVGLGSEPAFKVPDYDFRSPTELPLYLLLGVLCGLVSLALTRSTTFMLNTVEEIQEAGQVPKAIFPVTGALTVGLMALAYPEILYWGFQNVDLLLESRPFVKGLSAELLLQLVGVKIIATSISRASGLVGGYYAPSLFIGAATGMAYGKFIAFAVSQSYPFLQISFLEVASPQAYGLVGMAATLAGVCQVPLTSVLLLFELTQDYRIVLPLLGAVGMSSWITSSQVRRRDVGDTKKIGVTPLENQQNEPYSKGNSEIGSLSSLPTRPLNIIDDICEIESSRCFDDSDEETEELERRIFVSEAMRTSFAVVVRSTLLIEAVTRMLAEKQSYALIVNHDKSLTGILSLEDVLEFSKSAQGRNMRSEEVIVADVCSFKAGKCEAVWTATPGMDLLTAKMIMVRHGLSEMAVVSDQVSPVGVIDLQCINLARSVVAAKEYLREKSRTETSSP